MAVEHFSPLAVAETRGSFGRTDDVGEEHRRQDSVGLRGMAGAGQELLDLVHHRVAVADADDVVLAGHLHERGPADVLGQVLGVMLPGEAVPAAIEHQCGCLDRREHRAHVSEEPQLGDRPSPRRAKRVPVVAVPLGHELRVPHGGGRRVNQVRRGALVGGAASDLDGRPLEHIGRHPPRVVRRSGEPGIAPDEHKRRGPLRVGRGEEDGQQPVDPVRHHRGPLGAGVIEDCQHVLGSQFERWLLAEAKGV
jgi:hypothetical protein